MTKNSFIKLCLYRHSDSPLKHIERMHEDFELESLSGRKTTLSSNLSLGFYDILTKHSLPESKDILSLCVISGYFNITFRCWH